MIDRLCEGTRSRTLCPSFPTARKHSVRRVDGSETEPVRPRLSGSLMFFRSGTSQRFAGRRVDARTR